MTETLLWDLAETARQLGGVSERSVRRLIDRGELPKVRVGRRLLLPSAAVRAYVAIPGCQDRSRLPLGGFV